jgi:hypothetical protein
MRSSSAIAAASAAVHTAGAAVSARRSFRAVAPEGFAVSDAVATAAPTASVVAAPAIAGRWRVRQVIAAPFGGFGREIAVAAAL